jgi:cytidylate kinase
MNDARTVTVDGPAGSGKSTLGRGLAVALDLPFVDTGLFYRGITVAALRAGIDVGDRAALGELARATSLTVDTDPGGRNTVVVDGRAAGAALHDPRHAALLAAVASEPAVRAAVLELQRAPAVDGAVAVGRDCGTVVFPRAAVKFYLDAPETVREQRRLAQLLARGARADGSDMRAEVRDRDLSDTRRPVSPLRRAVDAHVIDTEAMGKEAMIELALSICADSGLRPVRAP